MSRPSDRPPIAVTVPKQVPVLTPTAARLLLALVRGDVAAPVVDLRISRSPDEPEALAS